MYSVLSDYNGLHVQQEDGGYYRTVVCVCECVSVEMIPVTLVCCSYMTCVCVSE